MSGYENTVMNEVLVFTTLLSPIILMLTELLKKTFNVPANYVPLMSLVIGAIVGLATFPFTEMDFTLRLWSGIIAGLGGTGIYEVFKDRK